MQSQSLSQIFSTLKDESYWIVDKKLQNFYDELAEFLQSKNVFYLDNPEKNKNFADYENAINFFLDQGILRTDRIVCVGGGATTDFGGFVAATILRGIDWIAVPTTMLAMVDASIGGKVGLNTKQGKNLIGAFHNPMKLYLSDEWLKTLPAIEFQSGLGEVIKYAMLDQSILSLLKNQAEFATIINACAQKKMQVVNEDYKETGIRKNLNLGHTFGHAFEKILKLPHGLAVLYGLQLNLRLFSPKLLEQFSDLLSLYQIDLPKVSVDFQAFLKLLRVDKKNTSSQNIAFVVLEEISRAKIVEIDENKLISKIQESSFYADYFI
jgi:3-dehydroquinate synthase